MLGMMMLNVHGKTSIVSSTRIDIDCTDSKPLARKCRIARQNKNKKGKKEGGKVQKQQNNFYKGR